MPNFQTFDYGQVLSQGEAIKGARLQNQLLQQEQDPNSMRNQLLREQLSGTRQGNALAQQRGEQESSEFQQKQEFDRLKILNAASAQVMSDPASINYWGPKLKESGALPPDYDFTAETPENIAAGAKTIYESTSRALGIQQPVNKLVSVGAGETLFDPTKGAPVYTAPPKPPAEMTPGEQARLAQAERFHKESLAARGRELDIRESAQKVKPVSISPTLQKELIESDDVVSSGANTIALLRRAKELSKKAYSGVGAGLRATAISNIPFVESEAANATVDLDNIMQTQALESLKSTFGAAPTEGERKILMDIQASSSKTPAQRDAIIARAQDLVSKRIAANKKKASAIRSGKYLTEEYSPNETNNMIPQGAGASTKQPSAGRFKIEVLQ